MGFQHDLHLPVVISLELTIVDITEVRHIEDFTNQNPRVVLQGLTKNPMHKAVVEGRSARTSLLNDGPNLKIY